MDELQKLLFPRANVRGETVALHESLAQALEHQRLPVAARRLAGEASAAALLAAAALQFDGTVQLQIDGDGPVRLLVVEVRKDLSYRVTVRMRDDAGDVDPNADLTSLVNANGRGRCAFILDMTGRTRDQQPYQGVVPLTGKTLAQALENYFAQSEQVETLLRLTADDVAAGGVMLQKMPASGGKLPEDYDPEGWPRLRLFADTVKSEELLTLRPEDVNRRLFWEESPLVTFEAQPCFRCSCSDARFDHLLRSLGEAEAQEILRSEGGKITITCRFCGKEKVYDAVDVAALFAPAQTAKDA